MTRCYFRHRCAKPQAVTWSVAALRNMSIAKLSAISSLLVHLAGVAITSLIASWAGRYWSQFLEGPSMPRMTILVLTYHRAAWGIAGLLIALLVVLIRRQVNDRGLLIFCNVVYAVTIGFLSVVALGVALPFKGL